MADRSSRLGFDVPPKAEAEPGPTITFLAESIVNTEKLAAKK